MKKVLLLLILAIFTPLSLMADDNTPPTTSSKEKIPIIILTDSFSKGKQTDKMVTTSLDAYINTTSDTIEIHSEGVSSNLEIYIINSQNEVVMYNLIEAEMIDCIVTEAPTYPGRYILVIHSDEIYGEGIFTI